MSWILRIVLAAFFALPLATQLLPSDEPAPVATITGRVVTDLNGAPLPNVEIHLIDPTTPDEETVAAVTDAAGLYTVTQPISNTWKIKFVPTEADPYFYKLHIPEYYNDAYTLAEATLVTAEVGTGTANINASLSAQWQVSGRVTAEASGEPLATVRVDFYYPDSLYPDGFTYTDSTGAYTLTATLYYPPADQVAIRFLPLANSGYALEFYDNKGSKGPAKRLNVSADRPVRGIDAALPKEGQIKGVVTSTWRGQPLDNPVVRVFNAGGELIYEGGRSAIDPLNPEPLGHYTVPNLPAGDYQIRFSASRHLNFSTSELIHLDAGEVLSGVNAQLVALPVVTSIATSPAIPNTIVLAFDNDPAPLITVDGGKSWKFVPSAPWVKDSSLFAPDKASFVSLTTGVALRGQPGEGTRIIVAAGGPSAYLNTGLYRSGDYGQSWSAADVDPPISGATCGEIAQNRMLVSLAKPSDFYLLTTCTNSPYAHLLTSDNAGVTWRDITTVEGRTLVLNYPARVAPSPVVEDRLYVFDGAGKWFQSNDAGVHWDQKNFPVGTLALDGKNANYLYGWSPKPDFGFYTHAGKRSRSSGDEWADWPQQPCSESLGEEPSQILPSPTTSQLLYLRCYNDQNGGIYRSEDGGDSWQKLTDEYGGVLAFDYGAPGRLLWAKEDGLWASTDKGQNWQVLLADYRLLATSLYLPTIVSAP